MATLRELMEQNQSSQSDRSTEEFILEEGEGFLTPDAEDNNEVSSITAGVAGIASGLIKVPEGVVSLGAELIDLGLDTNTAVSVEQFFDKINPFEEVAQERAVGRLTEALVQIGIPGTIGAKVATKLATKAINAKKAGNYLNVASKNVKQGADTAQKLNRLTGRQKFGAVVAGGAVGETMVADVEKLGTIGDAFGAGPIQLDRREKEDLSEDALRKLVNRFKFGSESTLITPAVYGITRGISKLLTKKAEDLAYSDDAIERNLDKFGGTFRFRGMKPVQQALAKEQESASKMVDTNFAMEQVRRIDKEIDKIFPETKKFFYTANVEERKQIFKQLNDLLFEGDLTKGLDEVSEFKLVDTLSKQGAAPESIEIILNGIKNSRNYFVDLLKIASNSPTAQDLPPGLQGTFSGLLGKRVKDSLANTFEIFENREAGFLQAYKPTRDTVDRVANIFMRYAAKNGQPITPATAEGYVNDIIDSVRRMDPKKDQLPSFQYVNLTKGADTPYNIKTFAQTLERNLPDGKKTFEVIGKGSKAFRELFGEIEDARHSIYEAVGRLSTIARRGELFEDMLDADKLIKSKITPETPFGMRGFFHATPRAAKEAFGPNTPVTKLPEELNKYFPDENVYTSKDIAEGFESVSQMQNWLRGEADGQSALGRTLSGLYRYGLLTPKAGAQFAKTVLSIPTHIRNFLSSGAFALANGTLLTSPKLVAEAMNNARKVVQVGMRQPEAMAKYREYLDLGIVNTNVRLGDLRNLMKDVRFGEGNIATDSVLFPMLRSLGKNVSKGIKKTGRAFQDAYVAEDDFWKIYNYEVELARLRNAYAKKGLPIPQNLKQEVAEIVKNTVPNYARVGQFVRSMRVSPFGNFMSWPSEIFRTGFGIYKQGLKELKNPVTRGIGMKRLAGMTFTAGALPYAIVEGSKKMFGVTNDEADAINYFVAPWARDSQKIVFKDPTSGEFYYIDWSKNNVYDTLTRPFQTVLYNIQQGIEDEEVLTKGFFRGLVDAAASTASPFISESIFTEAFMDIYSRGGKTREGYQLYGESTPDIEKYNIIFQHLAKTMLPSTQPFTRTFKAITGEPGKGPTTYEIGPEIAGIFGMRPIKINPERGLDFYLGAFQKSQSEDRKNFTGGKFGVLSGERKTPQEVVERFFIANQKLFETQRDMMQALNAAQTLGVTDKELKDVFDRRNLSKKTLKRLLRGEFNPFEPSENIEARFERNAEESGIPNPYLPAEPLIKQMIKDFENQSLNEPFNLKLEDYIPRLNTPGQQSSMQGLPPTPMPAPGMFKTPVQQNNVLASGLTRMEEVYLSPEEKQIRLRSRGLNNA